jgi:hypothetical protein
MRHVDTTYGIGGALNFRRSLTPCLVVGFPLALSRGGGEGCLTFGRRCGPGTVWLAGRAVVGVVITKINVDVEISVVDVDGGR